jgi:bifunctional non-homologous end joining protein LigD
LVSTPLEWKEVNHKLHPSQFDITNIEKRIRKKGDIFRPVIEDSNSLEKALRKLGA